MHRFRQEKGKYSQGYSIHLFNSLPKSASTFARASACAFARACSSEEGAFGAGPGAPDAAAGAREDDDGAGAAGTALA